MVGGMIFVGAYIARLAAKTTDVNWTKAKDLGDHMGYYKARSGCSTKRSFYYLNGIFENCKESN